MEVATTSILIFLALAAAGIGAGIFLLGRNPRRRVIAFLLGAMGWLLVALGTLAAAGVAGLQLTARLGPAQVWFRAPSFSVAVVLLLIVAVWWFRRSVSHPHALLIRFGLPALLIGMLAVVVVMHRLDGRSAPLSAFMPTLRATAPDLRFLESGGAARDLSDYRGKVVLVNFWATWCGPCRHEMPMLSSAQTEFKDDGLVVIYLSLEEPAVLEDFLRTHHFEGVQGRLVRADDYYHAGQIYPLSYLISRGGLVAKRWSGRPAETWLRESIRDEL